MKINLHNFKFMEVLEVKRKVVAAALEQLEELYQDLKESADMKLNAAGTDEDDTVSAGSFGSGDSGNEDMSKESGTAIMKEAEAIKEVIQVFKNYRFEKIHQEIGLLSMVITDKGNFFITRAVKSVSVDGQKYFLMATDAPIYTEMEGKKKGESFTFNNNTFKIKDLY